MSVWQMETSDDNVIEVVADEMELGNDAGKLAADEMKLGDDMA